MTNPSRMPMARRSLRNLFSKPATRLYPTQPRVCVEGARGSLQLDPTNCNFCERCAKRCPTQALRVSRQDRTLVFEELLCINCGWCVEVCNKCSLLMATDPPAVIARGREDDPRAVTLGRREWQGMSDPKPAQGRN
jgi:ech hydrogenase subunit F